MTQRPVSRVRLHASSSARLSRFTAILSVFVVVLAMASPAGARTPKPPKFSGAAPGSVSCSVSAKVSFSPRLTDTGGGTGASAVRAKLSGCHPSNSAVTIKSAKVTGSFSSSPLSCVTLGSTSASPKLTVVWKGNLTGSAGGTTYSGKAKFTSTSVSGATATGSFAGSSTVTIKVPSNLATLCAAKKGAKKATVTGTLTVGTAVGGPSPNGLGAVKLASDGNGYCTVLTSGSVACWGDNTAGELGNGTSGGLNCTNGPCDPTPGVATGITTAVEVVGAQGGEGPGYCALLSSGSVDCWGDNGFGELGNGTIGGGDCVGDSGGCDPTPGAVTGVTTATSVVSDGGTDYCALLTSGSVDCWGNNDPTPAAEPGITTATSVASDANGYCVVLTSGSVECWGDNSDGELGNGTTGGPDCSGMCNLTPGPVTGITTAVSLASDDNSFDLFSYCALLTSGSVDCWGANGGDLGNGTTTGYSDVPVAVTGVTTATSLSNDDGIAYCALLMSGSVDCWGDNSLGELGNGTTGGPGCNGACNPTPGAVTGVTTATGVVSDDADDGGYCAVLTSGSVDCWGGNYYGDLGNGTTTGPDCSSPYVCNATPGAVTGVTTATGVVSDNLGYCALLTSGSVDCWGDNTYGQLGNGSILGPNPNPTPGAAMGIGP